MGLKKNTEKLDTHSNEVKLLLETIHTSYGYDFHNYSVNHLERRIIKAVDFFKCRDIADLTYQVRYRDKFFFQLLHFISVNVTEMFRDPLFYLMLRNDILPQFTNNAEIKIWNAGCASGEEVYSVAILLHELGLLAKSKLYATDYNRHILEQARKAVYSPAYLNQYTENYHSAGGIGHLSDYYTMKSDKVVISNFLKERVEFLSHNLVSDPGLGRMDMIICRNVMIYFNRQLQNQVVALFAENLVKGGFLCVGAKESIMFTESGHQFSEYNHKFRIYQR